MNTKIVQWNANGIRSKYIEFGQFISVYKPQVICICETFLKENIAFTLNGYNVERRDRIAAKGGLATLIKENIPYSILPQNPGIESLSIQITVTKRKTVVTNLYLRPGKRVDIDDLNAIFSMPNSILVGDLNAYSTLWYSEYTDSNGAEIETLVDRNLLCCLNTNNGTHICHSGKLTNLDLTFVPSALALRCTWQIYDDCMGSDHLAVITDIDSPLFEIQSPAGWNVARANWSLFTAQCDKLATAIITDVTSHILCDSVTKAILEAARRSIPRSSNRYNNKRIKGVHFLDQECTEAIKFQNKTGLENESSRTRF